MRVLIAGGRGFIGGHLAARLARDGHEARIVSRGPGGDHDWSAESLARGVAWSDAVVNLAGAGIVDRRWTARRKRELSESRVDTTAALARAAAEHGTGCFLQGSAVGYYGAREERGLDESAPPGTGFLPDLCRRWEDATRPAAGAGIRVATVRGGIVLGDGGALKKMLPPFRLFLGGPVGSGRQWVPWIHIDDLVALYLFLLGRPEASGAYNGTAPEPVTMNEFARAIGRALRRPAVFRVPGFVLRIVLGEAASTILEGQHVVPSRALSEGFTFRFADIDSALADVLR